MTSAVLVAWKTSKNMLNSSRTGKVALLSALLLSTACGSDPIGSPGGPDASPDASSDASADARLDGNGNSDGAASDDGGPGVDAADGGGPVDGQTDAPPPPPGPVSILTQHYDIARTGANLAETTLTTANVNGAQFGKLFCRDVDDELYAQPLIVAGLTIGGQARDVLYAASVNDTVYAFDASDPNASAPLWQKSFLTPNVVPPRNTDMTGACGGQYTDYSGNMGITSTPVIDPAKKTMYVVARTNENGAFVQRLHALDITDGSERANSPTLIQASVPGTGDGSNGGTLTFDPQKQNQRSSLLLVDGVVYIGWSSHCDWGPYHGWLMGYDASTLQQVVVYNTTPDGYSGGIWMAGQGPASDGAGNIYLSTGNGSVGTTTDPRNTRNRGQSILRLRRNGATMDVASWFTPFDYEHLEGLDLDLGSAGVLLIPGTNLAMAGGKGATVYLVDRTTMGGLSTTHGDSQILNTIPLAPGRHLHGAPVAWNGPGGMFVYSWAEYDHLKSFRLDPATAKLDPIPVATSVNPAPDGMPGAMMAVSAHGAEEGSGILWANLPYVGNANQAVVPGVLRAFDAANVGVELWNSHDNLARDDFGKFAKFTSPTVANGKVYLSTFSGAVCAYGLLPNVHASAAPTSLTATASTKTRAVLTWTDNATDELSYVIERKEGPVGFAQIATAPANATTFNDDTATPFAAYSYRVRALGPIAPSAYSNIASVVLNAGSPAPRAQVFGNGRIVPNGETVPTWKDDTDFAQVKSGASASHTFTIKNIGNAPLNVASVKVTGTVSPQPFLIATPAVTPVAPGSSTTFVVSFTPSGLGAVTASVDVASDDPDQAHYTFATKGSGVGDQNGWWKLDDAVGQTAADSSGYGENGAGASLTWGAGHTGGAASFDGANSYIQVGDNAALSPAAITVSAWINPADWKNGNRRVLQKGANDDQYRFTEENGALIFDIAGVGMASVALPATNVWTHIAGTYDGAAVKLYVNGALASTIPATAQMPVTIDPLFIGTKVGGAVAGDHFKGLIDDVRIYGRALSASEITGLAQ